MNLFGPSSSEKEDIKIIDRLLGIVENLTSSGKKSPESVAKSLKASYYTVDKSGNIIFNISNTNSMAAQTITVLPNQNTVPGQIVPVAADGVTVEPISAINAGSEVYTSSNPAIATVAAVPGGSEGQFAVTRVSGQSGTVVVTYTAVNTAGTTITNAGGVGDTFIFQGQPTGVAAALTATYGSPS
jgi:hypothetical protein